MSHMYVALFIVNNLNEESTMQVYSFSFVFVLKVGILCLELYFCKSSYFAIFCDHIVYYFITNEYWNAIKRILKLKLVSFRFSSNKKKNINTVDRLFSLMVVLSIFVFLKCSHEWQYSIEPGDLTEKQFDSTRLVCFIMIMQLDVFRYNSAMANTEFTLANLYFWPINTQGNSHIWLIVHQISPNDVNFYCLKLGIRLWKRFWTHGMYTFMYPTLVSQYLKCTHKWHYSMEPDLCGYMII